MSQPNIIFSLTMLMILLLNPFLIIIYLIDLVQETDLKQFSKIIFRASLISMIIFIVFAFAGDYIFANILQIRFSSFLIFGGLIFLFIGIKFVFHGNKAIEMLRGAPEHITGAIVMPIMIGPGTISASVICGKQLKGIYILFPIIISIIIFSSILIILKVTHDSVKSKNEKLVERYIEITGRVTALVIGSYAIEMISDGVLQIIQKL